MASRWAGIETIGFCEIDKYCQKVLKKNFPGVPIYEDITELDGTQFKNVFLITGGFPCQDISVAGKGAGIEGERSGLWTELHRIISEVRPKYALIENVPALTIRGGARVIGDLTEIGYDTEWQIVGANDVGAPHRRKRIWIVAYANGSTDKSQVTGKDGLKGKEKECIGEGNSTSRDTAGTSGNVRGETTFRHETEQDVAYSNDTRCIKQCGKESIREKQFTTQCGRRWSVEPNVGRVAHGVRSRVDRLRGLGNAIVPQVAYEIMKCLK